VLAVVHAVAAGLGAVGIEWRLAGSAARMLRGASVRPGDVDIEVAAADGPAAARALGLPPPERQSGGGWSSLRTTGTINGVPIDLSAGLEVTGPGGTLQADTVPAFTATLGTVPGITLDDLPIAVRLTPPGESLARAIVAGSEERRAKALAALPDDPVERAEALAYCEERVAAAASAAR
jgi:hypothetical protein